MANIWLSKANNLSDVDSVSAARSNLMLGDDLRRTNLLDNSSFLIAQRGANSTGNTTSGVKALDRWYVDFTQAGSETYTISKETATEIDSEYTGLIVACGISTTADHGGIALTQRMEDNILSMVSGKTVSLSFWFKSGLGAITLDDIKIAGNLDNSGTGDFSVAFSPASVTYTSGDWLRYEGKATLPDISLARGFDAYLELRIGSTASQPSEWILTRIAAPKLEIGRVSTLWSPTSVPLDRKRCFRHYQRGDNTNHNHVSFYGDVTASNDYLARSYFLDRMYSIPTVTTTHVTSLGFGTTASTALNIGVYGFQALRSSTSTTAGAYFLDNWTAATGW